MKDFIFDEKAHAYFLDGKPLNGVTTILKVIAKPALIQWSANMAVDFLQNVIKVGVPYAELQLSEWFREAKTAHRKKKEEAGASGTDVHSTIETLLKRQIGANKGLMGADEKSDIPQVENFIAWARNNEVTFLESEKRLFSEKYWYAGTADIICEIKGKLYVGDVKTGSGIYPEHFIQASAYANALKEMKLYKQFDGVVIVNLKKDASIEVKENYDLEGNFDAFKACLTLHRQLEAINPKA